ncbi:hypothetical protein BH11PSE9_BH11PSE9_25550 [soil metagenome]
MGKQVKAQKSWATSRAAAVAALLALVVAGAAGLHHRRAHAVHESAGEGTASTMLAQHPPAAGATWVSDRPPLAFDPSLPSASEALGRQTPANQPFAEPPQAF